MLANSLGTTADMWNPQMPLWTQRFRVLRYEHRGHGATSAPQGPYSLDDLGDDAVDLLDHLGEPLASICGLSLGGMVALNVAARHPGRVDRLVLACTAAHLPPGQAWFDRATKVRAEGTGVLLEALLGRWFTPGFPEAHADVAQSVATMLDSADPQGYAGCCEAIGGMDQRHLLPRVIAPTLVLAGAADPVTPPELGLGMSSAIPGASLRVLPGAAHLANIEQPAAFGRAVSEHLAGDESERGDVMRRSVLGDAHVERSKARTTSFNAAFSDFITRYAWGDIWTRPGLDLRTRSCITLAMLSALGRTEELPLHVRGARTNGLSDAEIAEVLLQSAVYGGVPAANSAFAVAERTLDEMSSASDDSSEPGGGAKNQ